VDRDLLILNRLPQEIRNNCHNNPKCPRRILSEIARKKQYRSMLSRYLNEIISRLQPRRLA